MVVVVVVALVGVIIVIVARIKQRNANNVCQSTQHPLHLQHLLTGMCHSRAMQVSGHGAGLKNLDTSLQSATPFPNPISLHNFHRGSILFRS